MCDRHRLSWLLLFGLGVALRLALWSGFGLGDDPNFFSSYYNIYMRGTFDPNDHYAMRFGVWIPTVLGIALLGPTEAGFVGPITFFSIVNLVLIYLLARQEWEPPYALVAMLLLAVCPLDVLCSGLFANDIVLATYCFGALWLFRRSLREEARPRSQVASAVGSGVLLFAGFVTKPWIVFVAPMFLTEALARGRRRWTSWLVTGAVAALLVAGYLAWQWRRLGDPLHHLSIERQYAIIEPYSRATLLAYPRMLFRANEYGSYFAGYYPHVLLALAALLVAQTLRAGKWLAYGTTMLAGIVLLPAGRQNGAFGVLPQIFRYLAVLSIPLCLALTSYWRELLRARWKLAVVALGCFTVLSIIQCVAVTEPTRDAYGEQRRAIGFLRQFPHIMVWADHSFGARFMAFELHLQPAGRFQGLLGENPEKRWAEYEKITEGMVVTGGARNPWYNCFPCLANLDGFPVPETWSLELTLPGRPMAYRREPLRIWRVSRTGREPHT